MIRTCFVFALAAIPLAPTAAQGSPAFPGPFVSPGIPFVEDFEDGPANFGTSDDATIDDLLDNDVTTGPGGVGGGSRLLTTTTLDAVNAFQGVLFRAEAALGSSGLAFAGDFLAAGVEEFSFTVQHDAPIDLEFAVRFAPFPANFPGGFAIGLDNVSPNTPTELAVAINVDNILAIPTNPFGGLGFFEQPTVDPIEQFNTIFSNIGNLQFTVELPEDYAIVTQEDLDSGVAPSGALLGDVFAVDGDGAFTGAALFNSGDAITFGLDNVTLTAAAVPEPSTGLLLAIAGLTGVSRGGRR